MYSKSNNRSNRFSSKPKSFSNFSRSRSSNNFSRRVKNFTKHDVNKFIKKAKPIETTEYTPVHSFADFDLDPLIKKNLKERNYTHPTAIQDQAIKPLLENRDLIGIANTGTGKTAAFLLPLIHKVFKNRGKERVLIIAPTRELAMQIEVEFRAFSKNMRLFSLLCIGGTNMRRQIMDLRRKYDFVIGTPGRLKDLYNKGYLKLEDFQSVVLDEVDRMLDMGFIDDITEIIEALPTPRQTLFFSATLDRKIEPLMNSFLTNPVKISVKTGETSDNVEQNVVRFSHQKDKIDLLHKLLDEQEYQKVLIFDKTKQGVEDLCQTLIQKGFQAVSIHGDKTQYHRSFALKEFKKGKVDILVATDVAARGLDVDGISHVINYDTPESFETYTHRIGRTGRGNKSGTALTFVKQ